jgi:DNA-binding response OmpR family regulator
MGEVAIGSLAAPAEYIRLLFAVSRIIFAFLSPVRPYQFRLEIGPHPDNLAPPCPRYTGHATSGDPAVLEVGILIVDDDIASQSALKNVLDSEGWRVRIVPQVDQALTELATGSWNLAIVNLALADVRGPLFAILKELAEAEPASPSIEGEPAPIRLRPLFLIPQDRTKELQPILEREALPYSAKPYHLNDFLEKVSELLVEAGAIAEPIRSIGGFNAGKRKHRNSKSARDGRRGTMFASREDYQMTDEEMVEYEREEEEGRKKREKELADLKDRGGRA